MCEIKFLSSVVVLGFDQFPAPVGTPVHLGQVICSAGVSHFKDCYHDGVGAHNCGHHEDVNIRCRFYMYVCCGGWLPTVGGQCEEHSTGLSGIGIGDLRVQMCLDGRFGAVCGDGWGNNEALVACTDAEADSQGMYIYIYLQSPCAKVLKQSDKESISL